MAERQHGLLTRRQLLEMVPALRAAVDSLRWRGLVGDKRLGACLEAFGNHDGACTLRRLYQSGLFELESEGERDAWPLVSRVQPPPEPQVWITPRIRVDFLWAVARYILEYQGGGHDGLQRREDAERDGAMAR